jgi:large subunit ribosomal protein L24
MKKMKLKIKTGDRVLVLSGKDRGKTGTVSQVIAARSLVVVDGVNKSVKHMKTNQKDQKGQRIEYFSPIHSSNVMLIDEETGKPGRAGYTVTKAADGARTKTRFVKPSKSRKPIKKEEPKTEKKVADKKTDYKKPVAKKATTSKNKKAE